MVAGTKQRGKRFGNGMSQSDEERMSRGSRQSNASERIGLERSYCRRSPPPASPSPDRPVAHPTASLANGRADTTSANEHTPP